MTLSEFIDICDCTLPIWVQKGICCTRYENMGELIDKNEVGVYGRDWDWDEEIVEYVTFDGEGELTIELKDEEV